MHVVGTEQGRGSLGFTLCMLPLPCWLLLVCQRALNAYVDHLRRSRQLRCGWLSRAAWWFVFWAAQQHLTMFGGFNLLAFGGGCYVICAASSVRDGAVMTPGLVQLVSALHV